MPPRELVARVKAVLRRMEPHDPAPAPISEIRHGRLRRLSIGTMQVLMNLTSLALPLSGLWILRLYESALIRQTESELIAQGAVVLRGNGPAPSTLAFDRGWTLRVFSALPVLEDDRIIGAVLVARTPRTISEALVGKRRHLALLALLLLGSVGGLAALGSIVISTPLRAVTQRAKRVAEGERGALEPQTRPILREVAELSEALTRMAATLERRADYIRDFAAHVSHEFKTPLTTIRGTVELMREHLAEMSAEERDRFLANMDAEAERLSRLVARLLDLARADVMGGAEEGRCYPLAVAERLAKDDTPLKVPMQVDGPADLTLAMSEDAFSTVLANLRDNARQHGGSGVRMFFTLRQDGPWAVIMVRDDGPGISPANAARVFTPFFTTARKQGGTGLGLAIVHSLITAHGGSIALLAADSGAMFEIRLPMDKSGV